MHSRRSYSRWRLLFTPPRSGAENMARDSALQARAARTGETVFSVYSWCTPTISFGRNQPATGVYDPDRIRSAGLDVVRRPTGGRAILHDHEFTYSVTAPLDNAPSLREMYRRINRILLNGLSRLGVTAEAAARTEPAPRLSAQPCFHAPAEGELVANGSKLVGSAQWRDERSLLQHGSILIDDDQSSLPQYAGSGSDAARIPPAPATLASLMGRAPEPEEAARAMFDAVRQLEDSAATRIEEDEVRDEIVEHIPHYLDEGWTWRR